MIDQALQSRVVMVGTTSEEIANLIPFGRVLAPALGRELMALGVVVVPPDVSLSEGALPARKLRGELESLTRDIECKTSVRVAHHPWHEAQAAVWNEACDLMLVNWSSGLPEDVLRAMPCDVIVVNGSCPAEIRHILLPVRGGPYAAMALQVAQAFARLHESEITLLHAVTDEQMIEPFYQDWLRHLRLLPEITRWVNIRGDAVKAITRSLQEPRHQLLVMGAISVPQPGDPVIGPTATRILAKSDVPALIVKTRGGVANPAGPGPLALSVDHTISVVVDKWFAENSFHAHEFEDCRRLVEMKERQGVTISLCLPTLNEDKTIGKIVKTVRAALMRRYPLLDEMVVVDSNSSDRTVEIVEDLGVPVYRHPEILPGQGTVVGKGEALWKSLHVLRGDIVAWIDTDIVNIHPRFVYGILGPLLQEPRLMYVKGFYQRPLKIGARVVPQSGGRVTELVARPLFNLFYPELSGLVQPLAGEYAGRRSALEQVPFFTGYGVETGLLIDLLNCFGLSAIGQVDLEERVHRYQSLTALSKMAFAIIQVVMKRLGERQKIELLNALNSSIKLIRYDPEQFRLEVQAIRDEERPPINTIAEYLHAHGAPAGSA